MTDELDERTETTGPEPRVLAVAIGAYVEAMIGTGVDLDEEFEAAALDAWADLDDGDGDRTHGGQDKPMGSR
jgi:hypothetical protein